MMDTVRTSHITPGPPPLSLHRQVSQISDDDEEDFDQTASSALQKMAQELDANITRPVPSVVSTLPSLKHPLPAELDFDGPPTSESQQTKSPSPIERSPSPTTPEADSNYKPPTKRLKLDRQRSNKEPGVEDDEMEQFRKEAIEALTKIELEFARFREKMYQEKMEELEREEEAIRTHSHPTLNAQIAEIKARKDERLQTNDARLGYEEKCFWVQYDAAVTQAHTDFICKRGELRQSMLSEIEVKKWKMYSEKRNFDEQELEAETANITANAGISSDREAYKKRRRTIKSEIADFQNIVSQGGFPAAPPVSGLSKAEISEDLDAIGVSPKFVVLAYVTWL
ncbi:Sds3-like-domain-containing protein [Gaertneriomyces semiglobifer]|nr:Sds3-like-domain-containing protein [Gaertneriomyces semiglobifer]